MLRLIILLGAFLSGTALCEIKKEIFPISSILSSPFPSEMTSGNSTPSLAFVLNEQGIRNIYVAESPTYKPIRVTSNKSDDGIEISDLKFTPDDKFLVYVRGNSPNGAGLIPNPAAKAIEQAQSIRMLSVLSGKEYKVDEGSSPAINPNGTELAYIKHGEVRLKDFTNINSKSEKIIAVRGAISGLSWSPDGKYLLFVNHRETHSFIGIWQNNKQADSEKKYITWISPSVDRDVFPIWSPDGENLAFLRLPTPSEQHLPFEPIRHDIPWTIRIADPKTGESHEVWRADNGRGSVYRPLEADRQLFWTYDNSLIFAWEKTGWNQLYKLSLSNKTTEKLSEGNFEVQDVELWKDRKSLIFTSNQDDLDRRHLWKASLKENSAPTILTPGEGIEWSPTPLVNGDIGFISSTSTVPAHVSVLSSDSELKYLTKHLIPESFPTHLVEPKSVSMKAIDGVEAHGQLFLPSSLKPGEKAPVAIFLHGGSRRQMLLGWHMMSYYHNAYGLSQYFASRGIIALALNYRSGTGYGMDFREALNYGATGNSEFRDVLAAADYLKSRADVDPEKIAVWGGSYGGYLTAHALAQASDTFVAGVDIHGVHDWNDGIQIFVPHFDRHDSPIDSAIADRSSPFNYIDEWKSPVLLIHGDDDRNVHFSQSSRLVRKLRERDVHVENLVFPDEVHGFLLHKTWLDTYDVTANFLIRHLE